MYAWRDAEIDVREAVLHLLAVESDFFEVAKALAAEVGRPVDAGIARVEFRLLITAAEREIFLDGQPLARGLSECWNHRLTPGRRFGTVGFAIGHAASPASRSTSTSSQKKLLPCSSARRSEERSVGKVCVSTLRTRGA